MKRKNIALFWWLLLLKIVPLEALTITYNLRIATSKRNSDQQNAPYPLLNAATFVTQSRQRYDTMHQNVNALLLSELYPSQEWYIKADWAIGKVHEHLDDRYHYSRAQTDDVIVMAGRTFKIQPNVGWTLSGLLGIPTHKDSFLEGLQLGTGHVGAGLQADASWWYHTHHELHHAFFGAARYVHFFPAYADFNHQRNFFKVDLGNLVDILFAHHTNWGNNGIEFGYNATISFDASLKRNNRPVLSGSLPEGFTRHSFYGSYGKIFKIGQWPTAFIVGMSGGFDKHQTSLDIKHSMTAWITFGINF